MLWGSNVPQTRTPDAHFYTEARYRGAKSVVICPDYSEASKFADLWISAKQGTDAALGMAMGHVILREFHLDQQTKYFEDYVRQYTDMPMLVRLVKKGDSLVPDRLLRASDFADNLGETNNPEWKTVAYDETAGNIVVPKGSVGFRWGEKGKWNLEEKASDGHDTKLQLSLAETKDELADVAFPYFGNREHDHFAGTDHPSVLVRKVPAKRVQLKDGEALVASVFDLFVANYGVDRGFGGEHVAKSYDDNEPYTPAWAEKITGVPRDQIITVAREFALNAEKTKGRSMVIIGAGDEPLVPHGHELSRHHQHAGDVRLRRPVGRRLVALCRAGEAAAADRAGCRSPSRSTGAARRGSRIRPRSSTRTPTSGATRRSASTKSSRRPRRPVRGTAR